MNGQFIKKSTPNIVLLFASLALIGFTVFSIVTVGFQPDAHIFYLCVGGFFLICNLFVLFSMHTARFYVADGWIYMRHFCFGRLNCPLCDIAFVVPQMNGLLILLKNGKRYNIMGLSNSHEIARHIRQRTFALETESPDALRSQLSALTAKRKKLLYFACGGIVLMFAIIFITVALTGGRDIGEFSSADRIVLIVAGVVELIAIILLLGFANKAGHLLLPIAHIKYRLRNALIVSEPLPSGNVRSVYTDPNCFARLSVRYIPSATEMYFVVERVTSDHILCVHYESELFPDEETLLEQVDTSIDITNHFIPPVHKSFDSLLEQIKALVDETYEE